VAYSLTELNASLICSVLFWIKFLFAMLLAAKITHANTTLNIRNNAPPLPRRHGLSNGQADPESSRSVFVAVRRTLADTTRRHTGQWFHRTRAIRERDSRRHSASTDTGQTARPARAAALFTTGAARTGRGGGPAGEFAAGAPALVRRRHAQRPRDWPTDGFGRRSPVRRVPSGCYRNNFSSSGPPPADHLQRRGPAPLYRGV